MYCLLVELLFPGWPRDVLSHSPRSACYWGGAQSEVLAGPFEGENNCLWIHVVNHTPLITSLHAIKLTVRREGLASQMKR